MRGPDRDAGCRAHLPQFAVPALHLSSGGLPRGCCRSALPTERKSGTPRRVVRHAYITHHPSGDTHAQDTSHHRPDGVGRRNNPVTDQPRGGGGGGSVGNPLGRVRCPGSMPPRWACRSPTPSGATPSTPCRVPVTAMPTSWPWPEPWTRCCDAPGQARAPAVNAPLPPAPQPGLPPTTSTSPATDRHASPLTSEFEDGEG